MAKTKPSRRHKNPCQEDLQIRSFTEDTSINISPIAHNQINNKSCHTPSTDFLSLQSNASLDYSGLKCLFSSRNNSYSSTLIEAHNESAADFISEISRINDFFDLDAIVSDFKTPVKRIINTNNGNSETCILDNAETFIPIELTPPKRYDNVNSVENSFYTPQLYNFKSTSTPIVDSEQISIEHTREIATVTTVLMTIIALWTWLGATIKKGLLLLYKLYSEQSTSHSNCSNCPVYLNQMATLNNSLESVHAKLSKFEKSIKDLNGIVASSLRTVPPPPPPPPLPAVPPSLPNIPQHIITLDDILNVKLKKTSDRPLVRRGTEPNLSNTFKKILKPIK